jgi:hypothetical protein
MLADARNVNAHSACGSLLINQYFMLLLMEAQQTAHVYISKITRTGYVLFQEVLQNFQNKMQTAVLEKVNSIFHTFVSQRFTYSSYARDSLTVGPPGGCCWSSGEGGAKRLYDRFILKEKMTQDKLYILVGTLLS